MSPHSHMLPPGRPRHLLAGPRKKRRDRKQYVGAIIALFLAALASAAYLGGGTPEAAVPTPVASPTPTPTPIPRPRTPTPRPTLAPTLAPTSAPTEIPTPTATPRPTPEEKTPTPTPTETPCVDGVDGTVCP